MLAKLSSQVLSGIVDLVRTLVAGHESLEGELADLLIEDLDRLSSRRDMDFVNKVFIPLIKVERALPVTLGAARSAEPSQNSLMPGMSSLIDSDEPAVPVTPSFLTSDLLPKQQ
jgi:hypothetical protein